MEHAIEEINLESVKVYLHGFRIWNCRTNTILNRCAKEEFEGIITCHGLNVLILLFITGRWLQHFFASNCLHNRTSLVRLFDLFKCQESITWKLDILLKLLILKMLWLLKRPAVQSRLQQEALVELKFFILHV